VSSLEKFSGLIKGTSAPYSLEIAAISSSSVETITLLIVSAERPAEIL
jgi:hypothetical protein